jgi:AcrR family transcriptional regulator
MKAPLNMSLAEEQKSMPDSQRQIVNAAREIFQQKGYDGARMQDIADAAGINKALLHYYFKNKDLLFEAVFQEALAKLMGPVLQVLGSSEAIEWKVTALVTTYMDVLMSNLHIPAFVLHELTRNPQRLAEFVGKQKVGGIQVFLSQLEQGMIEGRYKKMDPRQALVHLLSMIVFPFVARPVIQVAFGLDDEAYGLFMRERVGLIGKTFLEFITR